MTVERAEDAGLVRHEEEARVQRRVVDAGSVRVHKHVETEPYTATVDRSVEHGEVERAAPADGDSGEIETLPDGSVSIPLFEEEVVITKRLVVRERVVVRKRTTTEEHVIETDLRRERVEVDADDAVELERD